MIVPMLGTPITGELLSAARRRHAAASYMALTRQRESARDTSALARQMVRGEVKSASRA